MTTRAELILSLRGNFAQGLQAAQREFTRTSQIGVRSMQVLSRGVTNASRALDGLGNRYAALATGAAAVGSGRFVIAHERRLTRLGITANLTADEVQRLNRAIYETAQQPNIRIDPSELLSAIEGITEKTGDLEFARNNLQTIALAIQATGASGDAVGELVAEFQKLGETDPKRVLELLDILNVQGKAGAFTLQNLAALGPRVITAYSGSVKGVRDNVSVIREMGAALQTIRQGTGSSEMAATAFESLLRDLQDANKQQMFRRLGVQIFQTGKDGSKALRPINQLMAEIMDKSKGSRLVLGQIFTDESIRAFNAFKPELIQSFMDVQANGTQTLQDSARAARDAAGAMQSLSSAWKQFADTNLTSVIQDLADGLNSVGPGTVQNWLKTATQVGVVVAGALALRKIWQLGRGIAGIFGAGRASAGATAGGVAGPLGGGPLPVPVYVVNKNMSLLPSSWNPAPGGGAPGAPAGRAATLARFARGAGLVGAAGAAGYGIGTAIYKGGLEGTSAGDAIGSIVAHTLALFGSKDAQEAIEARRRGAAAEASLNGTLRIQIDTQGRPRVAEASTTQPGVTIDAYAGSGRGPY